MASLSYSKPLKKRPYDYFFIVTFALFACTSFIFDTVMGLGLEISPESKHFLGRLVYKQYAIPCDPLVIANPLWLRTMCFISAFVWGPLYLFFVWGFIKGKNWMRLPAIIYGSALTYGMIVIFTEEFFGDIQTPNGWMFAAYNLPYMLVPILLIFRMRRQQPFS